MKLTKTALYKLVLIVAVLAAVLEFFFAHPHYHEWWPHSAESGAGRLFGGHRGHARRREHMAHHQRTPPGDQSTETDMMFIVWSLVAILMIVLKMIEVIRRQKEVVVRASLGEKDVYKRQDLTRWGRDYLQVGNAMEIFRRNNVRSVSYTHLPEDIRVLSSEEAAPSYHPRKCNCVKTYEYRILNRKISMPTLRLAAAARAAQVWRR